MQKGNKLDNISFRVNTRHAVSLKGRAVPMIFTKNKHDFDIMQHHIIIKVQYQEKKRFVYIHANIFTCIRTQGNESEGKSFGRYRWPTPVCVRQGGKEGKEVKPRVSGVGVGVGGGMEGKTREGGRSGWGGRERERKSQWLNEQGKVTSARNINWREWTLINSCCLPVPVTVLDN